MSRHAVGKPFHQTDTNGLSHNKGTWPTARAMSLFYFLVCFSAYGCISMVMSASMTVMRVTQDSGSSPQVMRIRPPVMLT